MKKIIYGLLNIIIPLFGFVYCLSSIFMHDEWWKSVLFVIGSIVSAYAFYCTIQHDNEYNELILKEKALEKSIKENKNFYKIYKDIYNKIKEEDNFRTKFKDYYKK